jgi:hypothetical protein
MSTKHALGALFLLSLAAPAMPALAREGKGGDLSQSQTAREGLKERAEEVKDRLLNKNATSTARRVELQQSVVKRIAEHTGKVLAATADRLDKIMARLESRIAKVKAEGGDTLASEKAVADAKMHLAEARAKLGEFSSLELTADKLSENMQKLRLLAADVKEHLGETRQALVEAVRALKPGRSTNNGKATSTATTTPHN